MISPTIKSDPCEGRTFLFPSNFRNSHHQCDYPEEALTDLIAIN